MPPLRRNRPWTSDIRGDRRQLEHRQRCLHGLRRIKSAYWSCSPARLHVVTVHLQLYALVTPGKPGVGEHGSAEWVLVQRARHAGCRCDAAPARPDGGMRQRGSRSSVILGDRHGHLASSGGSRLRRLAFVYIPDGSATSVNMAHVRSTQITASWYDPRLGTTSTPIGTYGTPGPSLSLRPRVVQAGIGFCGSRAVGFPTRSTSLRQRRP